MTIDSEKVMQAARKGIPLVIQTTLLPPQTELDLEEILGVFLRELGRQEVTHHLAYCLRELTGNAKKANTKRAYFLEKGLDILDTAQYEAGMATFRQETWDDIDRFLALQEKAGLHIRITFLIKDGVFLLRVANNAPLHPTEKHRISQRIERARLFDSMEQAFEDVLDDSEGAGLGITILVLMLRKMGLTEKAFTLEEVSGETEATLRVPAAGVHVDLIAGLTDELVGVVDSLPPFPENLRQLLVLLDKPDVDFEALARRLSLDPALTTDLIRYINSAGKGRRARVTNLRDAVQLVGLHGIREMILPYGTQKLLSKFIDQQKVLWAEAQTISTVALALARELRMDRQEQDLAQIGGLLSTLGRIVVAYLHPELDKHIRAFCRRKKIRPDQFNDLTQTINPAELGARVAEKWTFPSNLVEVLRYQAWPDKVSMDLYPVACLLHLASRPEAPDPFILEAIDLDPQVFRSIRERVDHDEL